MASQDLTTLAQVREHQQRTDSTNTTQDALIGDLITVASDLIMEYTQREFAPTSTSTARTYRYDGRGVLNLAPDDARSVTLVRIDTDTTSPTTLEADTQYKLWPTRSKHAVYSHLHLIGIDVPNVTTRSGPSYREVEVTGTWGWSAIPTPVERACIMLVMELLSRTSNWKNADMDALMPGGSGPVIPLHVRTMLAPYKRHSVGM
jgi:hypothetical protein